MALWPKTEQQFYKFANAEKLQIMEGGKLKQASCSDHLYRVTNAPAKCCGTVEINYIGHDSECIHVLKPDRDQIQCLHNQKEN